MSEVQTYVENAIKNTTNDNAKELVIPCMQYLQR